MLLIHTGKRVIRSQSNTKKEKGLQWFAKNGSLKRK